MTETKELPLAADTAPVNETVESQEDRVLGKLLAPKEAAPPAEAEPAKEEVQPEAAEDAAEGDEGASAELEKAITALRRAKIPQTVLKKMSNREILAMSQDVIERQAENDNTYRELGELRKKAKELESRQESPAKAEPGGSEQPSPNDLTAELAALTEGLGPDTAKALESFVRRHIEAGSKQSIAEAKRLNGELASVSGIVERMLTKEIRGDLRERFPDVDDSAKWEKVREKAGTLAKTGDYAGLEDPMRAVFEDAARLVLKAASATPTKPESHAKANGNPASKNRVAPPAALTPEQREDAALGVLLRGGSREKAKEAYG